MPKCVSIIFRETALRGSLKKDSSGYSALTFNTVAARFADTGGAQTRYAQTVRAYPSGVGCTARPRHKAKKGC